ncbi:MAG: single-stranded-DNA-specific exonuclease RecJ [Cyanobacteria bacterium J06606_4]
MEPATEQTTEQTAKPTTERRVLEQRWQVFPAQTAQANHIAEATALSPLLSQVLINRGIYTPEQAWEFLDPETLLLPSPIDEFPDLAKSLEILVAAINTKEKILICGDYDADGMTSTALLMRSLRYLGGQVSYAIPSRMDEGYGINLRIVEEFHAAGGRIILTVDNGIAAYEPIARAIDLGLIVILTDHHDLPETLPPANAILNPKLIRETSPYRGVAGVGVAYILAVCLAQRMGKMQDLTATLLALFTLGTIADLAPLTGVNRRWVKRGLKLLPKSTIPGIQALIEVAGLSEESELKPEAIGFRLGPRINAVGRIADPQIVIDLLTTDDVGVALQRAMQCEETNQLRRQMCEIIETQAVEWCEAQIESGLLDLNKERVLVVIQPEWHHGVIGIVASRLVERYGVPVFIGTFEDKAKKEIRGSARSIPEFNVFEALQFCDDLLDKYGGHRAAGGFSFQANKLRQVKSRLSNYACKHLQPEHLKPLVTVDAQADLADIDLELYAQIDQIHPCGIENPEPIFWTENVTVIDQKTIGQNNAHLKLTVAHTSPSRQGKTVLKAIAWRWGSFHPLPRTLDIAFKPRLNEWRGRRTVEIELVGARPAQSTSQASTSQALPPKQRMGFDLGPAKLKPSLQQSQSHPRHPHHQRSQPPPGKSPYASKRKFKATYPSHLRQQQPQRRLPR